MTLPDATVLIDSEPIRLTDLRVDTRVETLADVVREFERGKVRITPDGLLDDVDRNRIDARLAPFGWKCDPTCNLFESRNLRMLPIETEGESDE